MATLPAGASAGTGDEALRAAAFARVRLRLRLRLLEQVYGDHVVAAISLQSASKARRVRPIDLL